MSSSEDDVPLIKASARNVKSAERIPKSLDRTMDKQLPSNGHVDPGVSLRMGPMDEMDLDKPQTNGLSNGKRKSRGSVTQTYKEESDLSSEDEIPLSKRRKTQVKDESSDDSDVPLARKAKKPVKVTAAQFGTSSDSDVPLSKKLSKKKADIERDAAKNAPKARAAAKKRKVKDESDSDDVPMAKRKTPAKKATNGKAATNGKGKSSTPAKKGKAAATTEEENEEDDDEDRWWNQLDKNDHSVKWKELEHSGVLFPPEYVPLPKKVKLIYDGVPVSLPVEAEEVASMYGTMLNSTVNVTNKTFNANFFDDFKKIMDKVGHGKDKDGNVVKIKSFDKCDFTKIFDHYEAEREAKRALTAAEKKAIKAKKDADEEPFMYCMWDGRKQKVGNFRVEPPGLFRGRGEHPKTGRVKKRVRPEQITINIGKKAKIPVPPAGHKWKEVKHDQTGTWLAMWQENINGAYKYVMLAANSDIKGMSDYKKFEKARELTRHIDRIRKDYTKDLKSEIMADRQRATAIYLIDRFALRAGNEKGEDEADTVGCCSLKYENITLAPPNKVIFDFLGKDSIRFYNEVEVDTQVFKNLKIFKKAPKTKGDDIFDRLTTSSLNKHLTSYMPGLTAKVFRTYNASWTFNDLLKKLKPAKNIPDQIKQYNTANREVAILCNHKRTVAASHEVSMGKLQERIKGMEFQKWRIRMQMLDVEPKYKKKKGAEYFARPEHLDDDWVKQYCEAEVEEKREKTRKKFEKDNEKRVANGEKPLPEKELKERLKEADELEKKYRKEIKTGKVEAEGKGPTVEKLEAKYDTITQRIATLNTQAEDKEDNKEVALGTSKINYIDPRLTVVFSKKFNVPIERLFSKTLREKFEWAIKSVDENWEF